MSIGKLEPFDVRNGNWSLYVERMEEFFKVNKVEDAMQVSMLITVVGAECYELLVNLCTPKKPKEKTFQELSLLLENHLQPQASILAERFKFRNRKQQQGESIVNYVTILKKMSTKCDFQANLEENLRDQFACNILNENIRQRLFAEEDLDYGKAYKLALSLEAAEKDASVVLQAGTTACCHRMAFEGQNGTQRTERVGTRPYGGGTGGTPSSRGVSQRSGLGRAGVGLNTRTWSGLAQAPRGQEQCRACGAAHDVATCRFRKYACRVCNRLGHLKRMCPNLVEHHNLDVEEPIDPDSDELIIMDINSLSIGECEPIIIPLNVHGHILDMECDTGSSISCISLQHYQRCYKKIPIKPCRILLRYYTGETVRPEGFLKVRVRYQNESKELDLYVIKGGKTALLGRQWIAALNILDFKNELKLVHQIKEEKFNLECFSSRYREVFADGLGRFTGGTVSFHVREGTQPVFMRARPLAYALREPVERALDQLVRDDILTPVDRSDWATPIVPVVKKDGSIRICADFKQTINKVIEIDRYPLPKVEDLLVRLHGGERFSKIDLSQAYAQFELDEQSRKFTVINTHKGLFMYKRLVYGLSSSPGIFQRRLEQLFADMPSVGVFLDDVIITGANDSEHMGNLHKVFQRLQSSGLKVNKGKCTFFAQSVDYLGHVISKAGVHTSPDKVKAIDNSPAPTNVSELRAFIGMVMYYGKFVRNISTILAPMYNLLRANVKYIWSADCQVAFETVKRALVSSDVLVHYSQELPLVLTADASGTGVGAVISHLTPDGERPIAYASRTLTTAERAYAQIDREALSIVYGVRKFHQYLYGRKFVLRTDHKPLTYIFGNKVGIPTMAASRMQRWAILLSGYNYDIEYVASAKNCADALSRLPQPMSTDHRVQEVTYLNFVEDFLPVTNDDVKAETSKDILLSKVVTYVRSGWPSCTDEETKPFRVRGNELYVERGCLMWGYRIVVPSSLREQVLKQLHASHMGIVKTKSLARSFVWWPGIDSDVESMCKKCETCAAEAPAPARAVPRPWPYVTQPWSRLHIDFLGPMEGKTFFVMVDSSTKWLEVFDMPKTNAEAVIKVMRSTFARFGLPNEIVSDQGPPFTSAEFKNFLLLNGIRQSFSPVYHPASNGAAENAVKLCKMAIKKAKRDGFDIDTALQTYLLAYRNSIHATTGDSSAMLLQRRALRSRLDLLRSDRSLENRVCQAQQRQVEGASGGEARTLAPGEAVWARDYGNRDKWAGGTVVGREGSRRYTLASDDGRSLTRHIDQIRRRSNRSSLVYPSFEERSSQVDGSDGVVTQQMSAPFTVQSERSVPLANAVSHAPIGQESVMQGLSDTAGRTATLSPPVDTPSVRRSERICRPPVRFGFEDV